MLRIMIIGVLIVTCVSALADDGLSNKLSGIHSKIIDDYANVEHLSIEQFSQLDNEALVVFDVREIKEYQVSHIKGAIQVDPTLAPEQFLQQYGEAIKDKTVIFYCSVGRRSSKFAARVNASAEVNATLATYNLTGGLFHWHNQHKALVDQAQNTSAIHPYNFYWGRLIENRQSIRYSPIPTP